MAKHELNQAALAERLGATQGAVSQLLAGTTKVPSLGLATAIFEQTGIPTSAWLPAKVTTLMRRARRRTRRGKAAA